MFAVLNFIQQILSTPAIFVGLLALLGLLLQKTDAQTCVRGTIKTILGFIVLNSGADVVQAAIIPFGNLFQIAFSVEGVVPNNEAITSLGLTDFAVQTASIFALGMVFNIVLARFSSMRQCAGRTERLHCGSLCPWHNCYIPGSRTVTRYSVPWDLPIRPSLIRTLLW